MKTDSVPASSLFTEPPPVNAAAVAAAESIDGAAAPVAPAGSAGPDETEAPFDPGPTEPLETDDGGTPFDVRRHLHSKHPRSGRWMPRRQARNGSGPAEAAATGSFVGPDEPARPEPANGTGTGTAAAEPARDVYLVMADLHCRAFYGLSVAILSDEWLASREEHRANVDTLAAYYRAKGFTPESPGWALLAQGAAFAGKRLAMPKTQTRLEMVRAWIVGKIAGWRGARRAAKLQAI